MDEIQAIRQLKKDDIGGMEFLVTRYQVKAARVAFLITRDEDMAKDVVQNVFIRIYQHADRFDESCPFEPYLMRSVINSALNACRDERKSIPLEGSTEMIEGLISRAASVESQVEYSQMKNEILTALGKLPPRQRAAIMQRYYLGMSEKEMAVALDAAPGTVKWLLNSARTALRDLLEKGTDNER
jgi:RNA polymerase sigma-70 factor (ECF subfamily)